MLIWSGTFSDIFAGISRVIVIRLHPDSRWLPVHILCWRLKRPSPTGKYNILLNHLHFAKSGVSKVMPTDTKYIAILRDPADLFYSIFSHYYKDWGFNLNFVEFFVVGWPIRTVPGTPIRTSMRFSALLVIRDQSKSEPFLMSLTSSMVIYLHDI